MQLFGDLDILSFVRMSRLKWVAQVNRITLWRSWLRHCATSREVAGSIPDGFTGLFHSHNPSGRTMALALTQPLTETSTRNIARGLKAASA